MGPSACSKGRANSCGSAPACFNLGKAEFHQPIQLPGGGYKVTSGELDSNVLGLAGLDSVGRPFTLQIEKFIDGSAPECKNGQLLSSSSHGVICYKGFSKTLSATFTIGDLTYTILATTGPAGSKLGPSSDIDWVESLVGTISPS